VLAYGAHLVGSACRSAGAVLDAIGTIALPSPAPAPADTDDHAPTRLPERPVSAAAEPDARPSAAFDDALDPGRRPEALERHIGMWVAMRSDEVIAAASTSRELVAKVRELGDSGQDVTAQYVPDDEPCYVMGVG